MKIDEFKRMEKNTKFCHYTSIDNARNIISGNSIYLSKLALMNDEDELYFHENEKEKLFVFSLCNSMAKDIPLFYLYSGIDGKGCRIEFSKSKLINIAQGELVPVNKKYKMLKKTYVPNEDYEIFMGWIHYVSSDGVESYMGAKEVKKYDSIEDAKNVLSKRNDHYFIKRLYWKYEKEFRIVVRFKEDIPYERVALKFLINNKERGISLNCGPELSDSEMEEISEEFIEYGISNIDRFSSIRIKMNLVERNRNLLKG